MKGILAILMLAIAVVSCNPNQPKPKNEMQSERRVITFDDTPAVRPHSPAIEKNGMLFLSGQIGMVPATGKLAEGGINGETRQVLENLKRVVERAGYSMEDITACTVLLADISYFSDMNKIYMEYFPKDPPARKAFAVKDLPAGALIEIDAIAVK